MEGPVGGYVVNGRPCGWVRGKWKALWYVVNGRPCESVRSK